MKYKSISNYKDDSQLRNSFFSLAFDTFSLDFDPWYKNGFWSDKYIPYSIVDDENNVVSNVSVNVMNYNVLGESRRFIQIGTVMTKPDIRGCGLNSKILKAVIDEYMSKSDGIYLFANKNAVEYYSKYGFTKSKLFLYSKKIIGNSGAGSFERQSCESPYEKEMFIKTAKHMSANSAFFADNFELLMFYLYNMDTIYYSKKLDCYIAAEFCNNTVYINQIISRQKIDCIDIIKELPVNINNVILGFTPQDRNNFDVKEYTDEDTTLFILGDKLNIIEQEKLCFSEYSHA